VRQKNFLKLCYRIFNESYCAPVHKVKYRLAKDDVFSWTGDEDEQVNDFFFVTVVFSTDRD
jgi:hypothetical protein